MKLFNRILINPFNQMLHGQKQAHIWVFVVYLYHFIVQSTGIQGCASYPRRWIDVQFWWDTGGRPQPDPL